MARLCSYYFVLLILFARVALMPKTSASNDWAEAPAAGSAGDWNGLVSGNLTRT